MPLIEVEPQNPLRERLNRFGRRGWTLKPYQMWGSDKPCPPRLVVNPYVGCAFQHQYCYIESPARAQDGFREHLLARIKEDHAQGLDGLVVMVSSSTDPFQPIERHYADSRFALEALLENGFLVLVMTRNPQMLLEEGYAHVTGHPRLQIDVSIPSLRENELGSIWYSPVAAPLNETYAAIAELARQGKYVRVKIEPVVPSLGEVQGQTPQELDEIVRKSKEAGVQAILSKTMRLNTSVPPWMYRRLITFFTENGTAERTTLALSEPLRKALLAPVLDACARYQIPFCPCVDSDTISGVSCRVQTSLTKGKPLYG